MESLLAGGREGRDSDGDQGQSEAGWCAPHCSLSLRNESSTAGSGSRAQGSLSMLRPSRPSGSMRSSSSSPSPNSNPAADTSKPGTPERAAAISFEKPGEESPVWAEEMGEDPLISYCAIPHDHPHLSPVRMMLGPEPWREQWVRFWWLRAWGSWKPLTDPSPPKNPEPSEKPVGSSARLDDELSMLNCSSYGHKDKP